jgi:hypothetical protein
MGTIGRAKRFHEYKKNSVENPGVGRYNIATFINLSKAAGTSFESGNLTIDSKTPRETVKMF